VEPKNYIELPQDEYGNLRYYINGRPVVIQAHKLGKTLVVVAPMAFKLRWPDIKASGWREVDHEPGPVTVEEWKLLVSEEVL
jgi:hypothetical protein